MRGGVVSGLDVNTLESDQRNIIDLIKKFYDEKVDTDSSSVYLLAHFPSSNKENPDLKHAEVQTLNQGDKKDLKNRSEAIAKAVSDHLASSKKDIQVEINLCDIRQTIYLGWVFNTARNWGTLDWDNMVHIRYTKLLLEESISPTYYYLDRWFFDEIIYWKSSLTPLNLNMGHLGSVWYCIPYALLIRFGLKIIIKFDNSVSRTFYIFPSHNNNYVDYWQNAAINLLSLRYALIDIFKQICALEDDLKRKIKINEIPILNVEFANLNDIAYNQDMQKALDWAWGVIPFADSYTPGLFQGGYRISYEHGSNKSSFSANSFVNWITRQTTSNTENMQNHLSYVSKRILDLKDNRKSDYAIETLGLQNVLLSLNTDNRLKAEHK